MKVEKTPRGFEVATWTDKGGRVCQLQQSSAIDGNGPEGEAAERWNNPGTSFVWLGVAGLGLDTRMHLDRSQVVELVNRLDAWLKNGTFLFANERHSDATH